MKNNNCIQVSSLLAKLIFLSRSYFQSYFKTQINNPLIMVEIIHRLNKIIMFKDRTA